MYVGMIYLLHRRGNGSLLLHMKKIGKFILKKSSVIWMVIITIICLIIYGMLTYYINFETGSSQDQLALMKTFRDIMVVIVSILGVNLLTSALVDVKSRNSLVSDIMLNDVIAAPEFYATMDEKRKVEMYNAIERSLFFKYDITQQMYADIREKLKESIEDYYYTECEYSVSCDVHDNYIEKEVTNTRKIRSYDSRTTAKDFCIGSFSSKQIAGLMPYEIKSIEINGKKLQTEEYSLQPDAAIGYLDEQNEYDSAINCIYSDKISFSSTRDTTIIIHYVTRTAIDDRISTFRVKCPCKKFSLYYAVKQHEKYRLVVDAYGFLDDAEHSTNNMSKSNITISFSDWIFKLDGVSVVMLER